MVCAPYTLDFVRPISGSHTNDQSRRFICLENIIFWVFAEIKLIQIFVRCRSIYSNFNLVNSELLQKLLKIHFKQIERFRLYY